MSKIEVFLTLARCNLQNDIKKFIFEAFDENIDECVEFLEKTIELPKKENILKEISQTIKNNCDFIDITDKYYPELLKQIDSSPIVLTIKGNKEILNQEMISVVGSREIEIEDIEIINDLVKNICNDFIIVSGLAKGTDAIAHFKSLKTGTIAILANGLSKCYPQENLFLLNKIIDNGGCVISEYNFEKQPMQHTFLQRDKLIAGISFATLIMRAREHRCGTIATANYTRRYNRKLYSILPQNGRCEGNKWLLDNNYAKIIDNIDDFKYQLYIDIANMQLEKDVMNCNNNQLFEINAKNQIIKDKKYIKECVDRTIKKQHIQFITIDNLIKTYNKIKVYYPECDDNLLKRILVEMIKIEK